MCILQLTIQHPNKVASVSTLTHQGTKHHEPATSTNARVNSCNYVHTFNLKKKHTSENRMYYSLANFAEDFYEMRHAIVTGLFSLLDATYMNKKY